MPRGAVLCALRARVSGGEKVHCEESIDCREHLRSTSEPPPTVVSWGLYACEWKGKALARTSMHAIPREPGPDLDLRGRRTSG